MEANTNAHTPFTIKRAYRWYRHFIWLPVYQTDALLKMNDTYWVDHHSNAAHCSLPQKTTLRITLPERVTKRLPYFEIFQIHPNLANRNLEILVIDFITMEQGWLHHFQVISHNILRSITITILTINPSPFSIGISPSYM